MLYTQSLRHFASHLWFLSHTLRYDTTFETTCTECSYPAKYQTEANNRLLTCLNQTKCTPGFFLKQISSATLEGECTACPANQYQVTS